MPSSASCQLQLRSIAPTLEIIITTPWVYTARRRFCPATRTDWQSYLEWSHLSHIRELVTLDGMLCQQLDPELEVDHFDSTSSCFDIDERYYEFFKTAPHAVRPFKIDPSTDQVLAALEQPTGLEIVPAGFVHLGFDLMDHEISFSTLTNCGPIPEAFAPSQVNQFGLLPDCRTAYQIRDRLRQLQPQDHHLGACEVWSIARWLPLGSKTDPAMP